MAEQQIEIELINMTAALLAESGISYHREIKLDDSLQRRLGLDSLARAELFQRVEKAYHVSFSDKALAEIDSLRDLVNHLHDAPAVVATKSLKVIAPAKERVKLDLNNAQSLIEVLQSYAEAAPEQTHIYFQNESGQTELLTYGQLWQTSLRVAKGLKSRGLQPNEAVAIMQPTHLNFFYIFFGTLLAGGIPVPIYPPFRTHMLESYAKTEARILANAEVRMLVTFDRAEQLSHLLQAFVPSLKLVTTMDSLLSNDTLAKPYQAKSHDPAFIQYTSGSTNDPKGVLLSHGNLLANIRAYGKTIQVTPDDVAVSWLPLYHDFGLIGAWLGSFYYGIPLILMTPFTFLNHPERWLWVMHHYRATLTGAPNFAYELCVRKVQPEQLEGLDLSAWRVAANGAEKVYPRTLEEFAKKFAPYGFKRSALMPVYGLAESTVCLTIPPLGREFRIDHVQRKPFEEERKAIPTTDKQDFSFAGCGMPIVGHEIRIIDDAGQVLAERRVGNLQFRGPSNMQGYYNNPQATRAVFHDGWIDSGDLAYIADGELFISGRRKDLIIKSGRNLYPVEIEELVGNISGIRQGCVAAFGVIDSERGTDQLIVVAETRETEKAKRQSLLDAIHESLATALDIVPDHVELVAPKTVPKTSSGKLQRNACKIMYLEGRLHRFHVPVWLQMCKLGVEWAWHKLKAGVKWLQKVTYTIYIASVFLLLLCPLYFVVRIGSVQTAASACRRAAKLFIVLAGWRMQVNGSANLVKASPVVYVANHASYIDALIALALVPVGTRFVAKSELLSAPVVKTFIRKLNFITVDRIDFSKSIADADSMQSALEHGDSIFIFPEGTFGYAAGLRPFRLGAFKIATETCAPVCPVALSGTRLILRNDEKLLTLGRVKVTVSEPVSAKGIEWQDITHLRDEVRMQIAKDCGEPSLDYIAAQTIAPH